MALLLEINGVDQGAHWWHDREWRVEKSGTLETFTAVLCDADSGDTAYRPEAGETVRLTDDGDLIFGGVIVEVRDERLLDAGGDVGTVTIITARDYNVLAEEIVVTVDLPSAPILTTVAGLVTTFLVPKGVTNIGATSGGPTVAAVKADHQTLASVIEQLCVMAGYRARTNGDKQFACFAPGTIVLPTELNETNTWDALEWTKSRAEYASQLVMRTGGSGTVTHSETHTGDGAKSRFLLNVEPQITSEETSPGVITSTVQSPTEVNENGTTYAIGGGRWTYDSVDHAIVKIAGGPLPVGHTVTASYTVEFPAWVRVWDAVALEADGSWDLALRIDRLLQVANILDLAQCAAWGRKELERRGEVPRQANLLTELSGIYPFVEVPVNFPPRLLVGDYLVTAVNITPAVDGTPTYDLTLLEGDVRGRTWDEYYRERQGVSQAGGAVVVGSTSTGGGSSPGSGVALPFVGYGLPLGGSNIQTVALTTSWQDVGDANPMPHPADPSGTWTLRVYAYQLAAGTMEVRLLVGGVEVASISTTATGTHVDVSFFTAAATDTYTGPVALGQCLLQARVTSGARTGVIGQCHTVKTA